MAPSHRAVHVRTERGSGYDVIIGEGVLGQVGSRMNALLGGDPSRCIIADRGVPEPFLKQLGPGAIVQWNPSELNKTLGQATVFLRALAQGRLDRSSVIVALGGGITGDVAGFAAATYQRGIAWVNCPTTLLAMVDASVGGKTGVNIEVAGDGGSVTLKNMVGCFHQPALVAADPSALCTLPDRIFRAGLAECIKHGLIGADWGDPQLLSWMQAQLPAIQNRDPAVLGELVFRNVSVKAAVVASDERETGTGPGGGRMALNLGHTFAHAIEPIATISPDSDPSHAPLQHGEAVGLGLIAASRCAAALSMCPPEVAEQVLSLVRACGLPVRVHGLPSDDEILSRMARDKKSRGGSLRLILPESLGRVRVVADPPRAAVIAGLTAIRG